LSGSLEGAGGIGGVFVWHDPTAIQRQFGNHNYYHADGTVTSRTGEQHQTLASSYRYDAYGNLLSSAAAYAGSNTYRFSSKEWIRAARQSTITFYRFYDLAPSGG